MIENDWRKKKLIKLDPFSSIQTSEFIFIRRNTSAFRFSSAILFCFYPIEC